MASFLHDNATRTIAVVCTTHMIKENPRVWIGPNWESFLQAMKHVKASFKVIVCICDQNSFKNLFLTVTKFGHVTSFLFEFGQYMVEPAEVPRSSKSLVKDLVLFYAYLFPCKIKKYIKEDVLDNKDLPLFVEHKTSSFLEDRCLYKNKICLEALAKILKPIIFNGMVCLSVFDEGFLTYVCFVSHILHIVLNYCWPIFGCMISNYGFFSNCKRPDVMF